jgi:hypothetical protein
MSGSAAVSKTSPRRYYRALPTRRRVSPSPFRPRLFKLNNVGSVAPRFTFGSDSFRARSPKRRSSTLDVSRRRLRSSSGLSGLSWINLASRVGLGRKREGRIARLQDSDSDINEITNARTQRTVWLFIVSALRLPKFGGRYGSNHLRTVRNCRNRDASSSLLFVLSDPKPS